jgi:hypothetical protein
MGIAGIEPRHHLSTRAMTNNPTTETVAHDGSEAISRRETDPMRSEQTMAVASSTVTDKG